MRKAGTRARLGGPILEEPAGVLLELAVALDDPRPAQQKALAALEVLFLLARLAGRRVLAPIGGAR